jgi:hypothetical protein
VKLKRSPSTPSRVNVTFKNSSRKIILKMLYGAPWLFHVIKAIATSGRLIPKTMISTGIMNFI